MQEGWSDGAVEEKLSWIALESRMNVFAYEALWPWEERAFCSMQVQVQAEASRHLEVLSVF